MYAIKSCRGIPIERALVGQRGIVHDRRWMIVQPDGEFLTQREYPQLAVVAPSFHEDQLRLVALGATPIDVPMNGGGAEIEVVWRDRCSAVDQGDAVALWLSTFLGVKSRLVRMADAL